MIRKYRFGIVDKSGGALQPVGDVLIKGTQQEAFMLALKRFYFDATRYNLRLYGVE